MSSGQPVCRRCSAPLAYAPGQNAEIVCRFCGEAQPVTHGSVAPAHRATSYHALLEARSPGAAGAAVPAIRCGTCGAETTRPASVISDRCPFCDSPAVSPGTARLAAPDAVLPFLLDEAGARGAIERWERALWFKPGSLFASAPPVRAVYLPYWSFDWEVTVDYVGRAASGRNEQRRGRVQRRVTGSTVLASASVPVTLGADLEPWDLGRLTAPRPEILLGVRAETHGDREGLARGAALSHRLLDRDIDDAILRELGGERASIEDRRITYHAVAYRLLLLPVWSTSYHHGGRSLRVLVNGCTGEVAGERPVDRSRVALALLAPFALPLATAIAIGAATGEGVAAVMGFWICFALEAVLVLATLGSGAPGPAHNGQFFLRRPEARGTESLAEITSGLLQHNQESRRELGRGVGIVGLVMAVPPLGGALLYRAGSAPLPLLIGFHLFSALVLVALGLQLGAGVKQKRFLLGIDEGR